MQLEEARSKQAELTEKLKVNDQKYSSLQQECKFSQTNHEDKQKECEKTRLKQVNEIDELKQKIKELKKKFDDTTKEKEKEISSLKVGKLIFIDVTFSPDIFLVPAGQT